MKTDRLHELTHLVLDGEATAEEACELERLIAADSAAKVQFDEMRRLFDGLAAVPKAYPPEGLVASVMARLPASGSGARVGQLFSQPGVIGLTSREAAAKSPGISATVRRFFQPGPFFRGANMSEQQRGSSGNRKVWIGAGIAVAAVAVFAVFSAVDFPPSGTDAAGTIAPVQRYRAPQMTGDDVKVGGASGQSASTAKPSDAGTAAGRGALDGQRNALDGSRNALDGQRNALDGSRNAVDGQRNALDGSRNALDGSRNALDGSRNAVDGQRNALDGSRNALDGSRNALDGSRNALDGQRNALDGSRNALDGQRNALDAALVTLVTLVTLATPATLVTPATPQPSNPDRLGRSL